MKCLIFGFISNFVAIVSVEKFLIVQNDKCGQIEFPAWISVSPFKGTHSFEDRSGSGFRSRLCFFLSKRQSVQTVLASLLSRWTSQGWAGPSSVPIDGYTQALFPIWLGKIVTFDHYTVLRHVVLLNRMLCNTPIKIVFFVTLLIRIYGVPKNSSGKSGKLVLDNTFLEANLLET